MASIYNDATDDTPADAIAEAFIGMDMVTKPTRLAPGAVRTGKNMWADVDGILQTRPAAKFVALLNDTPGAGTYRIQGACYYDVPGTERILAVRQGELYELSAAADNTTPSYLSGPTFSTSLDVAMTQLVDRMFSCDGTLRWHLYSAGWTHGSVTQFSDATAMPTWSQILAHNFRLLAVESGGNKIYASAIGQANAAADWVKTDTIRVGSGQGDPCKRLLRAQGGNVIVLNEASAWLLDTTNATVSNWTSRLITDLTGCVEGKTAVPFGQDVLFLSRFGVVSLGALQTTDSINPAATLSAPIQKLIDRINWSAIGTAWATAWRDLYILALPIASDTYPKTLVAYHTRTGKWSTPWEIPLNDVTVSTGPTVTATFAGYSFGFNTRFASKQETIIGDTCGRLLRFDDQAEEDQSAAATSHEIESWATLRAMDYDLPVHLKQPFWMEVEFYRSTGQNLQINLVRDGLLTYPDKALNASEIVATGLATGSFNTFPLVFPLIFQTNESYRKSYSLRHLSRFREASLQFVAAQGQLRIRTVQMSAFIDSPVLNQ